MVNLGYITVVLANTLVAYAPVGFHEFGGRLNWQVRFVCPNAEIERFLALFLFFNQPIASSTINGAENPSILPTGSPFRTKLTGFLWLGDALFWVANQ